MGSGPETRYRLKVEKVLPVDIYRLKLNLPYSAGPADSWYSSSLGDLWIEYKWIPKLPVRVNLDLIGGKDPTISRLQKDWLFARHKEGRNVGVIVGTPDGGLVFPGIKWMEPVAPTDYELLDKRQVAEWIMSEMVPC